MNSAPEVDLIGISEEMDLSDSEGEFDSDAEREAAAEERKTKNERMVHQVDEASAEDIEINSEEEEDSELEEEDSEDEEDDKLPKLIPIAKKERNVQTIADKASTASQKGAKKDVITNSAG